MWGFRLVVENMIGSDPLETEAKEKCGIVRL